MKTNAAILAVVVVVCLAAAWAGVSADTRWRETHVCVKVEHRTEMRPVMVGRVTVMYPFEHDVCVAWTPKR